MVSATYDIEECHDVSEGLELHWCKIADSKAMVPRTDFRGCFVIGLVLDRKLKIGGSNVE